MASPTMRGARPQSPCRLKCILEPTASCFRPASALFIAAFCRWIKGVGEQQLHGPSHARYDYALSAACLIQLACLSSHSKVAHEPVGGEARYRFERPRLLEEVGRSRHDLEPFLDVQPLQCLFVHPYYRHVVSPNDQQRRRLDTRECLPGEIWTSAARDYRANLIWTLSRGDQGGPCAGARAEIADLQVPGVAFIP